MADRAYSRRRVPEGNRVPGTSTPRRGAGSNQPIPGAVKAFEVIDLDTHPDGKLLRLVVEATKLHDALQLGGPENIRWLAEKVTATTNIMGLYDEIAAISATTADGWYAKAVFASLYEGPGMTRGTAHAVAYSALRDALRLGAVS